MSVGVVLINNKGQYLKYSQTSSHSTEVYYAYAWTNLLNDATVSRSFSLVSKLKWKGNSPLTQVVHEIPAEMLRTVILRR